MKQFGMTMLTVLGLAIAAPVLSPSIAAQTASTRVVAHAFVPGVAFFTLLDPNNPFSTELVEVEVVRTANTYMLVYNVFDFGGGFSAAGSGSIRLPASACQEARQTLAT